MTGLMEGRLPRSVRVHRALILAAEELGSASLDDVISLASAICHLTIYEDAALQYLRAEDGTFDLKESNGEVVVSLRKV